MQISLQSARATWEQHAISQSKFWADIADGLFPSPIPSTLGSSRCGKHKASNGKRHWGSHESELMLLSRIRGASKDEKWALAREIEAQRLRPYTEMCRWYERKFSEPNSEVAA